MTAKGDDESDKENKDEDDANLCISASEFKGDLSDIPKHMLFEMEECGAIFCLPSDKGEYVHICGYKATTTTKMVTGFWGLGKAWKLQNRVLLQVCGGREVGLLDPHGRV
jgi:hypothetical protein